MMVVGFYVVQREPHIAKIPLENLDDIFHVEKGQFIGNDNEPFRVVGVNIGQWLVREGYLWELGEHTGQTYKDNYAEYMIRDMLAHVIQNSNMSVDEFLEAYENAFITVDDIEYISSLGVNLIRIPFSEKDFSRTIALGKSVDEEFMYLDRALAWCTQYKIYCLFDLHVASSPQSTLSHADSHGEALYWKDASAQKQTQDFWGIIAQRYQSRAWLAGFDLLNEPQAPSDKALSRWYAETVHSIRETGNSHTLFIQPNNISLNIASVLQDDDNSAYIPHYYGFGSKVVPENQILFDQKNNHSVAVAIGEVGNWANDWWAQHTDKYVVYRYFEHDIPVVYWTYKDMVAHTQESFGIVSGTTGPVYQQFKDALNNKEALPKNFPYSELFKSFKTVFPTDRPFVEQIILGMRLESSMNIPQIFNNSSVSSRSRPSDQMPTHGHAQGRVNPYAQSFARCDGLTVRECFGW